MARRALLASFAVVAAALLPTITASCSDDPEIITPPSTASGFTSTSSGNGGAGGTKSTTAPATNVTVVGTGAGGSGCAGNGDACGDGGVCAGSQCCAASQACADSCCGAGDVCSFQQCATPGGDCHDSTDCPLGQYCELSLGDNSNDAGAPDASCVGGAVLLNGKCLPQPPECAPDAGPPDGGAITCLEKCEFHPTGTFSPVLKFAWGGQLTAPFSTDVMMAPIVIELDDDDCDGKVTEKDIPEIVFSTFNNGAYSSVGTLHAISIVSGAVVDKWSVSGVVNPTKQIAGGDIDGVPGNEVVACGIDGAVHAFHGDGTPLWTSPAVTCFMPSIADVDGDGATEVIVEGGILDGATGAIKAVFTPPLNGTFVVSDIDGDGQLDVVTSARGYHGDGTMFVDTGIAELGQFDGTQDWKSPWPAVGDFDHDGKPEVVVVDNLAHALSIWRYDATQPQGFAVVRSPVDINALFPTNTCGSGSWGSTHGGGPPTIADFDGDGVPDVGTAGGIGYVVFSGKALLEPTVANPILWASPTVDCSSASTGSTVFDFDGDGKAEVVYSDENHLRIYDGATGTVLFSTCNTTATLVEFPVVADVDNDGQADIVVVSNAYGSGSPELACNDGVNNAQSGVRIFGDANGTWVRTRRVWNEHAYHVTNVNEDGTIPSPELPNWTQPGLDNFRQNKQPGSEFAAPDVIVDVAPVCPGPSSIAATVRNIGEAALPAGVVIGIYAGTPGSGTLLGQVSTLEVLYPAQSEVVTVPAPNPAPSTVYAIADDTTTPHPSWRECRTDNNTSAAVSTVCGSPK